MRKLVLAISMLAFAGSAASADPLQDRQALMKERGKIAAGLSKVVKGETPYEAASVLTALQALQANAEKFDAEALFPAGSDKGDTTAAPKIWQDMAGFKETHDNYLTDVKAAVAAAPADVDALKTQFGTIGKDCGTCHQTYRIKKG
ncbi:cytochrome c [Mesorhizobium sp. M00.F.Ca.ET.216.01.1.1]|uniref:c-type cytochrome n=1 Tax=Mesorhizobium sp. M00.F.Ca.ET.216.01.1.1 TaxID=2500528 RepID=UPI000FD8DB24|nr:cytochrome c [Mesorhizobium sp. M00.F.Ca.ET.216.01.1.1]TGQ46820.1 cytochrome C556 [Mesorhizobium sp. M00.F.Ca.ET.216.01.1.1]TJW41428.1 MAG: cytochrome C556 [Mesorhizobium sp.]